MPSFEEDTFRCPNCQVLIKKTRNYCFNCFCKFDEHNKIIPLDPSRTVSLHYPRLIGDIFCSHCGHKYPIYEPKCPHCGKTSVADEYSTPICTDHGTKLIEQPNSLHITSLKDLEEASNFHLVTVKQKEQILQYLNRIPISDWHFVQGKCPLCRKIYYLPKKLFSRTSAPLQNYQFISFKFILINSFRIISYSPEILIVLSLTAIINFVLNLFAISLDLSSYPGLSIFSLAFPQASYFSFYILAFALLDLLIPEYLAISFFFAIFNAPILIICIRVLYNLVSLENGPEKPNFPIFSVDLLVKSFPVALCQFLSSFMLSLSFFPLLYLERITFEFQSLQNLNYSVLSIIGLLWMILGLFLYVNLVFLPILFILKEQDRASFSNSLIHFSTAILKSQSRHILGIFLVMLLLGLVMHLLLLQLSLAELPVLAYTILQSFNFIFYVFCLIFIALNGRKALIN
jgi:hypothetical protein